MATPSAEDKDKYDTPYQWSIIDVEDKPWAIFGNALIGFSTLIMILQNLKIGPGWVYAIADDVTTVLFTIELLVRVFEKGYLFVVEEEKYWNFFDTLVVSISVGSMVATMNAGEVSHHKKKDEEGGGGGGAAKLKMLRVLRLLRLLRLLRVLKGIEKVTAFVDVFLRGIAWSFIAIIVISSILALCITICVAFSAYAKAWLMVHKLPPMPKIE